MLLGEQEEANDELTASIASTPPAPEDTSQWQRKFAGRTKNIEELNELVDQDKIYAILIVGMGGIGKSTLAEQWLKQRFPDAGQILRLDVAKDAALVGSAEAWVQAKVKELGGEPGAEFSIMLGRLQKLLETDPKGILIDNLEPAMDPAQTGRLLKQHSQYRELLAMLGKLENGSITVVTSREELAESLPLETVRLKSLTPKAWEFYWKAWNIQVDAESLADIHRFYGGNALAMDKLREPISTLGSRNLKTYWERYKPQNDLGIEKNIKNLLMDLFDRLQEQPIAYRLLCRIGCFRFQYVPRIPMDALYALLWEENDRDREKAVQILQYSVLLEWDQEEFWLHPYVSKIAVTRLKDQGDWEATHRKAAEFWTYSVQFIHTVNDVLKAFEAYYHYTDINDTERAMKTILYERKKTKEENLAAWEEGEPLGRSFYKLGLSETLVKSVSSLQTNAVSDQLSVAKFFNLLGCCYWSIGDLWKAIAYYELSLSIANELQKTKQSETIKLSSLKQIGICLLDLYEIDKAIFYIEKVVGMSGEYIPYISKIMRDAVYLLTSKNNSQKKIHQSHQSSQKYRLIANIIEKEYPKTKLTTGFKEYSLLFSARAFLNIGNYEKAMLIYQRSIAISETYYLRQIHGKSLIGISEIYQIKHKYREAREYLDKALLILEDTSATGDIAEVYFQYALIYQAIGEHDQAKEYKEKALEIFEQMEAPKQIERVNQAFGGNIQ